MFFGQLERGIEMAIFPPDNAGFDWVPSAPDEPPSHYSADMRATRAPLAIMISFYSTNTAESKCSLNIPLWCAIKVVGYFFQQSSAYTKYRSLLAAW